MRPVRHRVILAIAVGWCVSVVAQTPPRDRDVTTHERTATLRGRVVGAAPAAPLRETPVIIVGADDGSQHAMLTDSNGHFEFAALAAGEYRIRVGVSPASARYLPFGLWLESP